MNAVQKNVVFFLLSSLTVGCRPAVKDCLVFRSVHQPGGKVVKRQVDQCNHNQVLEEQEFRLDSLKQEKPDGYHRKYFPTGKLKEFSFFKNGRQDSVALFYDEKGQLREKTYYAGNRLFGPQYFYSADGALDSTEFYTQFGKKWLTLLQKKDGGIMRTYGGLLHITLPDERPRLDSLPLQVPLRMMNEVPKINGVSTAVNIKISQGSKVYMDSSINHFIPFDNGTIVSGIRRNFTQKGNYRLLITVTLDDSISKKQLAIDTLDRKLVVY